MTLIIAALVALLAFFVQGFTGFGASLVLAPLLLFVLDLHTAVVASALVQVPIGMWLTWNARTAIDRPALGLLLPASVIGLVAGTLALALVETIWLQRLCGLLTALFALDVLRRVWRGVAAHPWPNWAGAGAGLVGGVLGGLFGTSGPPVVAFLETRLPRGAALRGTLLAYFLSVNSLRIVGYAAVALFSGAIVQTSLAMLPAAAVGAWAGATLQQRVGERGFRLAVAGVLLATGVALAVR
jgi:uncharacterized membrane protein YfcA